MKFEFGSTILFIILSYFFPFSAIFSFSHLWVSFCNLLAFGVSYTTAVIVDVTILLISIIAAIITSGLKGGVIYALEDKFIITHKFFKKRVFVSSILYDKIESAEYNVKASYYKGSFRYYNLILTIYKKSGSEIKFYTRLNIKKNFPTENTDEYNEYLNKQPLVKMCRFINEMAE